ASGAGCGMDRGAGPARPAGGVVPCLVAPDRRREGRLVSAREEILDRVRRALEGVGADAEPVVAPRTSPSERGFLVERFTERVADYRAAVTRCSSDELEDRVAAALPEGHVVVAPGLDLDVPRAVPDRGMRAAELDQVAAL